MLFWISAAVLILLAVAFLLIPFFQERKVSGKATLSGPLTALAIVPVSVGLYFAVSTYDPAFETVANADEYAMLEQLAERLNQNPNDFQGWALLGRSYLQLGDYTRARAALEEAWQRTATPDDSLKLSLAESMLFTDRTSALSFAGDLVEQVVATSPGNQRALWWGGLVALERDQPAIAARHWTDLLATDPPPEIAELVRSQLVAMGAAVSAAGIAGGSVGPVIELEISVADGMPMDTLGPNAFLFVFARAEAGAPPIVAKRFPVTALPGHFSLSDADAMIAGRTLAGQDSVTVVARISVTGEPTDQPGDLFGEIQIDPEGGETGTILIDQIVPEA